MDGYGWIRWQRAPVFSKIPSYPCSLRHLPIITQEILHVSRLQTGLKGRCGTGRGDARLKARGISGINLPCHVTAQELIKSRDLSTDRLWAVSNSLDIESPDTEPRCSYSPWQTTWTHTNKN